MISPDESVQLKIPIVLGVSGHRELDPLVVPVIEDCLRSTLRKFKEQHPHTPLVLISPLAKGADQLVARVAHEKSIEAQLFVVLPMPQRMYLADFDEPESLDGFHACLDRRKWFLELPLLASEAEVAGHGAARDQQYHVVGEFIVRHCQILIAIWDGKAGRGTGGTAEVVAEQLEGLPASRQSIEPPEGFPVWRFPTNRAGEPRLMPSPDCPVRMYPEIFRQNQKKADEYFSRIFERIETFNRRVEYWNENPKQASVAGENGIDGVSRQEELDPEEMTILKRHRAADALAIYYQKMTRNLQYAVHLLVFLAFFLFVLYAHAGHKPGSLIAAGVVLSVALAILAVNRYFKIDSNYQDFRAAAEALRVAFFWQFAGISKSVADYYLRNQRSELDWIRCGLRGWHLQRSSRKDPKAPAPSGQRRFPIILRHWINAERDYFQEARKKNERLARRNRIVLGLLLFGALIAGVMLLLTSSETREGQKNEVIEHELVVFDAFLAAGALMHHFNERMAYHEHAKQYERMHVIFSYASRLIDDALQAGKLRNARHWIYELGKQALAENGDWVLLHRERPVEVPHP